MQVEINMDRSPLAPLTFPESNGCRTGNKGGPDDRKLDRPPLHSIDAILGLRTWRKRRRSPSPPHTPHSPHTVLQEEATHPHTNIFRPAEDIDDHTRENSGKCFSSFYIKKIYI